MNGTQYISHQLPKASSQLISSEDDDMSCAPGETVKERNRRLLTHDRLTRTGSRKNRSQKSRSGGTHYGGALQAVEEENTSQKDDGRESVGVDISANNDDKTEHLIRVVRQRMVMIFPRKKCGLSGGARRTRQQSRKRIDQRRERIAMSFGQKCSVGRPVKDIISLYSCSLFRYAMF